MPPMSTMSAPSATTVCTRSIAPTTSSQVARGRRRNRGVRLTIAIASRCCGSKERPASRSVRWLEAAPVIAARLRGVGRPRRPLLDRNRPGHRADRGAFPDELLEVRAFRHLAWPCAPARRHDEQLRGHQGEIVVGLVLMGAGPQVDLGDGIQPALGGRVKQGGELDPVAHRDAERFHQLAPRGPLSGQRLDHPRQLRPPHAQQRTRHQFRDPAAFGGGGTVRSFRDPGVEPLDEQHVGVGHQRTRAARSRNAVPTASGPHPRRRAGRPG